MRARKPGDQTTQIIFIDGKPMFPISWLHKQDYCEYQIFLENIKGVEAAPTEEMVIGDLEHKKLYDDFKKEAVPATLDEMLLESQTARISSRELPVRDPRHGIYGLIDEVLLGPESIIVVDDKPGTRAFRSSVNQVFGYCLAFRASLPGEDRRPILGALRERGTDNIYWRQPFDREAEAQIMEVVRHIHSLISGAAAFVSSNNPNKCRPCRFRDQCERRK